MVPSSSGEARTAADSSSATRARWMAMRDSGCTPPCPAAAAASRSRQASRAAPSAIGLKLISSHQDFFCALEFGKDSTERLRGRAVFISGRTLRVRVAHRAGSRGGNGNETGRPPRGVDLGAARYSRALFCEEVGSQRFHAGCTMPAFTLRWTPRTSTNQCIEVSYMLRIFPEIWCVDALFSC